MAALMSLQISGFCAANVMNWSTGSEEPSIAIQDFNSIFNRPSNASNPASLLNTLKPRLLIGRCPTFWGLYLKAREHRDFLPDHVGGDGDCFPAHQIS
jgi:hypothetical protein